MVFGLEAKITTDMVWLIGYLEMTVMGMKWSLGKCWTNSWMLDLSELAGLTSQKSHRHDLFRYPIWEFWDKWSGFWQICLTGFESKVTPTGFAQKFHAKFLG